MKDFLKGLKMGRATSVHRLGVFAELEEHIEAIQHYDGIQLLLRAINIALLMGTFGAIGFLFTVNPQALPFSQIAISIFICSFAFLMNIIILSLDLALVERLIISVFIDALRLEKENPWLFPIHSRMMNTSKERHGSLAKKIKFYIGYSRDLLLLLLACIFFLVWVDNWILIILVFMPLAIFFVYGYGRLLKSIAIKSEQRLYKNLASELGELGELGKWTIN